MNLTRAQIRVGPGVDTPLHLGASIGPRAFVEQYVSDKIDYWVSCVRPI